MGTGGRERYRVVSLSGDLVEKSGTMTGGGKQVFRGKMSSSIQQDFSPIQVCKILAFQLYQLDLFSAYVSVTISVAVEIIVKCNKVRLGFEPRTFCV